MVVFSAIEVIRQLLPGTRFGGLGTREIWTRGRIVSQVSQIQRTL